MVANWMAPSQLSQIYGACDPASLCDRNFGLIAARFNLSLPPTNVPAVDEDAAPGALQANFSVIASALGIALFDLSTAADPEAAAQTNFELINAAW